MNPYKLKNYCNFTENRVYLLMAIARKKENPEITSSNEIVFREVVKNEEDIERKIEKLENTCNNYGEAQKFRLYLSVNARNTEKAYFKFRERMNSWIEKKLNGQKDIDRKLKRVDSHWKSELQKPHSKDETFFLFDLDTTDEEAYNKLREELKEETEIKLEQVTPNGYHIVTEAFNHKKLPEFEFDLERHNDRMVFLKYIN